MSSQLVALIDDYKARHGNPSDASIARSLDIAPQTISSWRKRGLRELPDAETLRKLADFLHVDRRVTFEAAGIDAGYITAPTTQHGPPDPPDRRAVI
jgi:hypothetical protein